jgi:hypothetical protein
MPSTEDHLALTAATRSLQQILINQNVYYLDVTLYLTTRVRKSSIRIRPSVPTGAIPFRGGTAERSRSPPDAKTIPSIGFAGLFLCWWDSNFGSEVCTASSERR